jgi:hypothetical protein
MKQIKAYAPISPIKYKRYRLVADDQSSTFTIYDDKSGEVFKTYNIDDIKFGPTLTTLTTDARALSLVLQAPDLKMKFYLLHPFAIGTIMLLCLIPILLLTGRYGVYLSLIAVPGIFAMLKNIVEKYYDIKTFTRLTNYRIDEEQLLADPDTEEYVRLGRKFRPLIAILIYVFMPIVITPALAIVILAVINYFTITSLGFGFGVFIAAFFVSIIVSRALLNQTITNEELRLRIELYVYYNQINNSAMAAQQLKDHASLEDLINFFITKHKRDHRNLIITMLVSGALFVGIMLSVPQTSTHTLEKNASYTAYKLEGEYAYDLLAPYSIGPFCTASGVPGKDFMDFMDKYRTDYPSFSFLIFIKSDAERIKGGKALQTLTYYEDRALTGPQIVAVELEVKNQKNAISVWGDNANGDCAKYIKLMFSDGSSQVLPV